MATNCMSCGMPAGGESKMKGDYCEYCADENGKLHPRERVQGGIAQWLKSWAKKEEGTDFMKRADNYMKAMPAWTE